MNKTDQNQASEIQKKVYPMRNSVYEILCNKENRDDFKLIQYGNIENDDQTQLVGTKEQLNQWMIQFKQQKQGDRIKAENESRLDRMYSAMILLRRLTRLILQFIFVGIVVGFFSWGYYVTVENSSWSAKKILQILIYMSLQYWIRDKRLNLQWHFNGLFIIGNI